MFNRLFIYIRSFFALENENLESNEHLESLLTRPEINPPSFILRMENEAAHESNERLRNLLAHPEINLPSFILRMENQVAHESNERLRNLLAPEASPGGTQASVARPSSP